MTGETAGGATTDGATTSGTTTSGTTTSGTTTSGTTTGGTTTEGGRMTTLPELRDALGPNAWLDEAIERIRRHPAALAGLFPAAGRRCGRVPLPGLPGWTSDEAARVLMLAEAPAEVEPTYRYGDGDEKRAVLKALPLVAAGDTAVALLADALRTNDPRLVAAALGPYAVHLDQAAWRQGLLKCVFMGVPLAAVHGVRERADAELAEMLSAFAKERTAAGREVPADARELLDQLMGA
ncbi:EboA domain-containing protein [Actinoplanes sp. DH11]|uniref:EboA domain-containing protein n=1 Tax=Actinoplanes sp. DH11 TaxID=2857011 RepID=UPI0027BACF37|nr:EboA domain-containing protein [Actinoplanes sp. DH11]